MNLFKAHVAKYAHDCTQSKITSKDVAKYSSWNLKSLIPFLRTALTQGIKASPKAMPTETSSRDAVDNYVDVLHKGIPGSAPADKSKAEPSLDVRGNSPPEITNRANTRYA